ncbi:MAG: 3-methyl-2-oxobutanoate hydroxymethyltransferase [Deltaproteobacteria bacterium]|nr:3-methyl-2-oxobutanoate hydroxymethyltransferase [Deltaproteobacteria bacterium]
MSTQPKPEAQKPVTIHSLRQMKTKAERIAMVTAYDATFARLFDQAGIDAILVGDSLGMVVQGQKNTLPVTMDEMVYHTRAVVRGVQRAHVIGDLPFMSYQGSDDEALKNAGRLIQEGGASSVKLEGGSEFAPVVQKIWRAGIPVMGHIGLTPQSVHKIGGFVVQGRDEDKAKKLFDDALALEQAGCYAIVLEAIPAELAADITRAVSIPTIGIGAGKDCDGQILVSYDLLGMISDFKPKFVKKYADLATTISDATKSYVSEVRGAAFPAEEHTFHSKTMRVVRTRKDDKPADAPESEADAEVSGLYGVPV